MSKIEGPVTITIADIYLRFPEITPEEYKDLIDFLIDNSISYEHVTSRNLKEKAIIQGAIAELKLCKNNNNIDSILHHVLHALDLLERSDNNAR